MENFLFMLKKGANMMKKMFKKLVFSLLFAAFSTFALASCNGNETIPTEVVDDGDGYVDKLPENTADGTIMQAFNWTFNQITENLDAIANAGFKTIQTSPVQQPKSGGASWWSFYQPLSFSIADNSPLGTKDELKHLCDEAEKRNISIIVDIVFNHMANISDEELEADGTPKVSPDVELYEPEIYNNRNLTGNDATFHHNPHASGSGSVTQVYQYGKLPDLNTANPLVQKRSLDLLKECIDVGVDGFRFDAVKHIETPEDPDYASDFWPNVLVVAEQYYKTKTGKELFAYGELLNNADGGRDNSLYTKYMHITEDGYIGKLFTGTSRKNGKETAEANYTKGVDASNLVSWVYSHDSYSGIRQEYEARLYGILASRSKSRPMYLAHPDDDETVGLVANYYFESELIAVSNRFHNRFLNCEENKFGQGTFFINERFSEGQNGVLIADSVTTTEGKTEEITFQKLPDGVYYDQLTGKQYVVKNHKAKITFDPCGLCVLTRTKNPARPRFDLDVRGGGFVNKLSLNVSESYTTSAYYQVNGGEKVVFTGKTKIDLTPEEDVTIKFVLQNNGFTIAKEYKYKKFKLIDGYFNIIGLNKSYFEDHEIYFWSWGSGNGKWSNEYTVQNGIVLVNFPTDRTKFLIGLFPKGYKIADVNAWDSNCQKQTKDLNISDKYYDASSF